MKKSHRWAVLAVAVLSWCCLSSLAVAQGTVRSSAAPKIALLDVSYIFENHARFKAQREDMMAVVKSAENQVQQEREAINKLIEQLQQLNKGTRDYQQMEEMVAKRQADLAVKVRLRKNDFVQQEAKIYYNVYQEIWQATDDYCKRAGIDMVLRFNGDPVDINNPQVILSHINKPVIWYNKQLDITPLVLRDLNGTATKPAAARRAVPTKPGVPFNR